MPEWESALRKFAPLILLICLFCWRAAGRWSTGPIATVTPRAAFRGRRGHVDRSRRQAGSIMRLKKIAQRPLSPDPDRQGQRFRRGLRTGLLPAAGRAQPCADLPGGAAGPYRRRDAKSALLRPAGDRRARRAPRRSARTATRTGARRAPRARARAGDGALHLRHRAALEKSLLALWKQRQEDRNTSTRCAERASLLAGPDDAVDEGDFAQREAAILERRVEAFQFDALGRHAAKLLGHHFAGMGLDHHPVAAPQSEPTATPGCGRRRDRPAAWTRR